MKFDVPFDVPFDVLLILDNLNNLNLIDHFCNFTQDSINYFLIRFLITFSLRRRVFKQ